MTPTFPPMMIQYRALSGLHVNPDNAKDHPAKQLAKLSRAMKSFGVITPILIDENGMILCGHARYLVAKELGLDEVPTVCVSHLSEAQRRAFVLADNKCAESDWNQEKLALELETILKLDSNFEINATGFEIGEVDHHIEQLHKPVPEPALPWFDLSNVQAVCRNADLWIMGRHRLFCGSALDAVSSRVLLGKELARMVITDIPYNLKIEGTASGLGKVKHKDFIMAAGEMSDEQYRHFLRDSFQCMKESSTDGSIHFIFIDWRQVALLIDVGKGIYSELKSICVWDKGRGAMGSMYRNQHELVAVFKSGKAAHVNNIMLGVHGRNRTNVWHCPGMGAFAKGQNDLLKLHPTVKPVQLIGDAILDCSDPHDLILDPFSGSGSLALACERTNRRAAMIELDPHYCDVALRRFADATGIEPYNAWTGEIVRCRPKANGVTSDVA